MFVVMMSSLLHVLVCLRLRVVMGGWVPGCSNILTTTFQDTGSRWARCR